MKMNLLLAFYGFLTSRPTSEMVYSVNVTSMLPIEPVFFTMT